MSTTTILTPPAVQVSPETVEPAPTRTSRRDDPSVLVWTDVETTGFDPHEGHRLLQVACIVTDVLGNQLDEPFEAVVRHDPATVAMLRTELADDYVNAMHQTTGLWDRLSGVEAVELGDLDDQLMSLVTRYAPARRCAQLAGNSPRLDLNFVDVFLPRFAHHLHHRFIDVTGLAVTMMRFGVTGSRCPITDDGNTHDAVWDIHRALTEYRWLREQICTDE